MGALWWWTVMGGVVFVIDTLAAHRITRFATVDHFPPVANLRLNLAEHFAPSPWARGFVCPWCVAPWVVLLIAAADGMALYIGGGPALLVVTAVLAWPAMATLVGLISERDGG